jgi:hypothetical protein
VFKAPAARSKPLRGVQNAFGVFKVQSRFAAFKVQSSKFKVQGSRFKAEERR